MKAKKRLGQHFLRDPHVLSEIAAIADVAHSAGALEIGPGEGALTAFLARSGKPIVALEKDPDAIAELAVRFEGRSDITVVPGDALHADLAGLLPPAIGDVRPVVVGNLPYNVGSAIYRRLLGLRGRVSRIVLMLQREVALRIAAEPGSKAYGVPTIMTALSGRAWSVLDVPPEAFEPRPKVQSTVILVELDDEAPLDEAGLHAFDRFLGLLFRSRRKTLNNADETLQDALSACAIDRSRRPESLTPEEALAIFRALPPLDA